MATPMNSFPTADDSEFVLDDGLDDGLDNEADADVLEFETMRSQQAEAEETAAAAALTPQRPANEKNKILRALTPDTRNNNNNTNNTNNNNTVSGNKVGNVVDNHDNNNVNAILEEDEAMQTETKKRNPIIVPQVSMASIASIPIGLSRSGTAELEITGLPVGCNRTHLEALVGTDSLKGIRLGGIEPNGEIYGPTKITVTVDAVERVLSLREPVVRGKRVVVVEVTAGKMIADTMRKHLPMAELSSCAAKLSAALEAGGEHLDSLNQKYEITDKAAYTAEAVAAAAKVLDDKVGASRGATAVAEAASVAAKEMDDSWRVSERARDALNAALTDDRTAPAARMLLGAIDSPTPQTSSGRKKDYPPSAERRNPVDPDANNDRENVNIDATKTKLEF